MPRWKRVLVMPAVSVVILGSALVLGNMRGAVLSAGSAPNQAGAETKKAPLEVQILASDIKEGKALWRVANVSGKDVMAYCIVVRCPEQEKGCQVVHTTIAGLNPNPPGDLLRAGNVKEHRGGLPSGSGGWISSVDYVRFADGSAWGPDTMKKSRYIDGVLEGRRGVYALLQRILKTQGAEAVVNQVQTRSQ